MIRSILLALSALLALDPLTAAEPAESPESEPRWHLESADRDLAWRQAAKRCEGSEAEGVSGWRLPTADELWELAARAEAGAAAALEVVGSLGSAAAWSRDASPSNLAWAAAFEHGYLVRLHVANERGLRALCVRGLAPDAPGEPIDQGSWMQPLDLDSDSPLVWPCGGAEGRPVLVRGSLASFGRGLPPGPLQDRVPVDFVIDESGRPRWVGPAPGTPDRFGRLAVQTLDTFRFEPATCDGEPIPVFYHLDFGGR